MPGTKPAALLRLSERCLEVEKIERTLAADGMPQDRRNKLHAKLNNLRALIANDANIAKEPILRILRILYRR